MSLASRIMNVPRKTIRALIAENRLVSGEEITRAMEYERSLLGDDFQFPRDGEIYEAVDDIEITYLTHWSAPFTGGDAFVLKKGERVRVKVDDQNPEPISVYAKSTDEERLEREIILEETRTSAEYSGYSLSIESSKLSVHFRLIG